jgi:lipid-A-disaccharide synthase-like uncharacterized protein
MLLLGAFADGSQFLGIDWDAWKVLGWMGNALFASRFFVQWLVTERRKRVIIPISFWWLSLSGSLLLLVYGIHKRDSVFIFAYAFTWIPYIRNIVIHHRNKAHQVNCTACGSRSAHQALFCHRCGVKLPQP